MTFGLSFLLAHCSLVGVTDTDILHSYSGLLRRQNALSMLWVTMAIFCVVQLQWMLLGYVLLLCSRRPAFDD